MFLTRIDMKEKLKGNILAFLTHFSVIDSRLLVRKSVRILSCLTFFLTNEETTVSKIV